MDMDLPLRPVNVDDGIVSAESVAECLLAIVNYNKHVWAHRRPSFHMIDKA